MRALTRTAAVEWGPSGITCNVICPSAVSPQAKDYFEANPEMTEAILRQVPAGRFGDAAKDIGPVAVFLASEGGGYMSGNTLFADGGAQVNGVAWRPAVED
jgi:NAD(P)-dependent dehydrogenase (short-subunit alcohol dehydrogenase family)